MEDPQSNTPSQPPTPPVPPPVPVSKLQVAQPPPPTQPVTSIPQKPVSSTPSQLKAWTFIFIALGALVGLVALNRLTYNKKEEAVINQIIEEEYGRIKSNGIPLVFPAKDAGKFRYQRYDYNQFDSPALLQFVYTPQLFVNVYKKQSFFSAPTNCGDIKPSNETWATTHPYACPLVTTTPRGRKIYGYNDASRQHVPLNNNINVYFVPIGDTLLSMQFWQNEATTEDIVSLVDALEPVSGDEFETQSKSIKDTISQQKKGVEQYVKFDVFTPQYIPKPYKLYKYVLGNVRDSTFPEMLVRLNTDADPGNGVWMYEWHTNVPFDPPTDCGPRSAENEITSPSKYDCKLLATTQKGVAIYVDGKSGKLSAASNIYFKLESTKITIFNWTETSQTELLHFVDELKKTPLKDIKYVK